MLDFKPFQTVKISTVISYKYLKSLFFYSYFPIPPQQTHEAAYGRRRRSTYRNDVSTASVRIVQLKSTDGKAPAIFLRGLLKGEQLARQVVASKSARICVSVERRKTRWIIFLINSPNG